MSLPRSRAFYTVLILLALAVVVLANAHLVIVAGSSQPRCVAHIRARDIRVDETATSSAGFSAAASSC